MNRHSWDCDLSGDGAGGSCTCLPMAPYAPADEGECGRTIEEYPPDERGITVRLVCALPAPCPRHGA